MPEERCELLCLDLPRAESLRKGKLTGELADALAARAKALADPTRLQIALALRRAGELCVCDLAWISECSEKLASHHVRQLRVAGLARSRRDGRMVIYELTSVGQQLVDSLTEAGVTV